MYTSFHGPRLWSRFFVILAAITVSACDQFGSVSPEQHVARAKDYYEKGELSAATIELKNALQANPEYAEARRMLGQVNVDLGNGAAAEKEFRRAVQAGLEEDEVAIDLARALLLQRKFAELVEDHGGAQQLGEADEPVFWALKGHAFAGLQKPLDAHRFYDRSLSLSENEPEALVGKARLLAIDGNIEDANQLLGKVFESDPDFAGAWSLKGDLERYQRKLKAADRSYTKAIDNRYDNARDRYSRALVRIYAGDMQGALEDTETLEKMNPNHVWVLYLQGLTAFQEKRFAESQTFFEQVLSKSPNYLPAFYHLGMSHFFQQHFEQAAQYLSPYYVAFPREEYAAKALAATYLELGSYDEAEQILQQLLAQQPDNTELLAALGEISLAGGNPKQSTEYFQKVAAADPNAPRAHLNLGLGWIAQGNIEQGAEALNRAAELAPESMQAEATLIMNLLRAKEYDQATDAVKRMRERHPDSHLPLTMTGIVLLNKGDEIDAQEAFAQALAISPGDRSASHNLARLKLKSGHIDEARALYVETLEHYPNHIPTLIVLARLEDREGQRAKAVGYLQKAILADPESVEPRVFLAQIYYREGKVNEALSTLQEVQALHPNQPQLLLELGKGQLASGRTSQAVSTLEKLVQARPDSANSYLLLANAYMKAGSPQNTRTALEKAVSLRPGHLPSELALARLELVENDVESASKRLGSLPEEAKKDPAVLELEGDIRFAEKRYTDAITAYQSAFEQGVKKSALVVKLAKSQNQAGQVKESIQTLESWIAQGSIEQGAEALNRAAEPAPESMQAESTLIMNLLRAKEYDQATDAVKRMRERHPDSHLPLTMTGIVLLNKGDETEAQEAFAQALAISPGDPSASHNLARLKLKSGDVDEARALYVETLARYPNHIPTLIVLARLEDREGQPAKAVGYLQKAILADPESVEPRVFLAQIYSREGKVNEAVSTLQEVQALHPNQPQLLLELGKGQLASGRTSQAVSTLEKLVKARPDSANSYFLLANAYMRAGNQQNTRTALEKAVSLRPGHLPSELALSRLELVENDVESASKRLDSLPEEAKKNPAVLELEGDIRLAEKRYTDAITAYQSAFEQGVKTSALVVKLAKSQNQAGQVKESIQTLENWANDNPQDVLSRTALSELYLANGENDKAIAVYKTVLAIEPNNVNALNNLAYTTRKTDPEKALTYAERAREIAPRNPFVMDTMGMVLLEKGDYQRSIRLFRDASSAVPASQVIRYHLALALASNGDKAEAIQVLEGTLANQGNFPERAEAEELLAELGRH